MRRGIAAIAFTFVALLAVAAGLGGRRARRRLPVEAHPPRAAAAGGRRGRPDLAHARRAPERGDAPAGDRREQPGANGGLAAGQVARSTPDGYTLFMAVDTNSGQSQPLSQSRL